MATRKEALKLLRIHRHDPEFKTQMVREKLKDAYIKDPMDTYKRAKRANRRSELANKAYTSSSVTERIGSRIKLAARDAPYALFGQVGEAFKQSRYASTKAEAKSVRKDYYLRYAANLLESSFGIAGEAWSQKIRTNIQNIKEDDPRLAFQTVRKSFDSVIEQMRNIEDAVQNQNKKFKAVIEKITENSASNDNVIRLGKSIDGMNSTIGTIQSALVSQDKSIGTIASRVGNLEHRIDTISHRLTESVFDINRHSSLIENRLEEMDTQSEAALSHITRLQQKIDELEEERSTSSDKDTTPDNKKKLPLVKYHRNTLHTDLTGGLGGIIGGALGGIGTKGALKMLPRLGLVGLGAAGIIGGLYLADEHNKEKAARREAGLDPSKHDPVGHETAATKDLAETDGPAWGKSAAKNSLDIKTEKPVIPTKEQKPGWFTSIFNRNRGTKENEIDAKIARAKVDQEKSRFMQFGTLPTGFEFIQGHMGRLGSPAAVAASGAQPLVGGDASPYFPSLDPRSAPYSSGGRQGGYGFAGSTGYDNRIDSVNKNTAILNNWKTGGGFVSPIGGSVNEGAFNKIVDVPVSQGAASVRYNNPGAAYPSKLDEKYGLEGYGIIGGGHKIGKFPSVVHGAAANFALWERGYTGLSLQAAVNKWRGGNGSLNVPDGFDPNMKLTKEMLQDKDFTTRFFQGMAKHEAGRNTSITAEQWAQAHDLYKAGGLTEYNKQFGDKDNAKLQPLSVIPKSLLDQSTKQTAAIPVAPQNITEDVQKSRPDYFRGKLKFGDKEYDYGSGAPGATGGPMKGGSVPYGEYNINSGLHYGANPRFQGNSFRVQDMFDPKWGRDRTAILFHSASDLDKMYSAGCFAVSKDQWPEFRQQMLDNMEKHGDLVVRVGTDGNALVYPKNNPPPEIKLTDQIAKPVSTETFVSEGKKEISNIDAPVKTPETAALDITKQASLMKHFADGNKLSPKEYRDALDYWGPKADKSKAQPDLIDSQAFKNNEGILNIIKSKNEGVIPAEPVQQAPEPTQVVKVDGKAPEPAMATNQPIQAELDNMPNKPIDQPAKDVPEPEAPAAAKDDVKEEPSNKTVSAPNSSATPKQAAQTDSGRYQGPSRHTPETRDAQPGSGGRGASGRCFI